MLQREILSDAMPGREVEMEGGSVFDAEFEDLTELGWLAANEDEGGITWTTTNRGRVALELDSLVRGLR